MLASSSFSLSKKREENKQLRREQTTEKREVSLLSFLFRWTYCNYMTKFILYYFYFSLFIFLYLIYITSIHLWYFDILTVLFFPFSFFKNIRFSYLLQFLFWLLLKYNIIQRRGNIDDKKEGVLLRKFGNTTHWWNNSFHFRTSLVEISEAYYVHLCHFWWNKSINKILITLLFWI